MSEYLFDKGLEGFESNSGFSVVKDYVLCQRKGCVGTASFIPPYVICTYVLTCVCTELISFQVHTLSVTPR